MIVCSLEVKNDLFHFKEDNEKLLSLEVPYYSVIGALIYLTNYTWLDITFFVNLLAKYSFAPTRRHWNRAKHVL